MPSKLQENGRSCIVQLSRTMYTLTSVIRSGKYYISGRSNTPASSGWKKDREGEERLDQTEKRNLESGQQIVGVELLPLQHSR